MQISSALQPNTRNHRINQQNQFSQRFNHLRADVREWVTPPTDFFKGMTLEKLNSKNTSNENIVHRFVNKLINTGGKFYVLNRIAVIHQHLDIAMKDLKASCEHFGVDLDQLLSETNTKGRTAKQCLEDHYKSYLKNKIGFLDSTKKSLALLDPEHPISLNQINSKTEHPLRQRLESPFTENTNSVRAGREKNLELYLFLSPATMTKREDIFYKTPNGNTILHRFIDQFGSGQLLGHSYQSLLKTGIQDLKDQCEALNIDINTILNEKNNKGQTPRDYFIDKLDRAHSGPKPDPETHTAQKNRLGELFDNLVLNRDTYRY